MAAADWMPDDGSVLLLLHAFPADLSRNVIQKYSVKNIKILYYIYICPLACWTSGFVPSAHVLKPVQTVDSAFSCVFFGHRGEGRNYVLWELGCIDTFFVRSVLLLYIVSTDLSKKTIKYEIHGKSFRWISYF